MNAAAERINRQLQLDTLVSGLKRSGLYSIGPCPFCGGRDRFNIKHGENGDLWICRQCSDGKYQDTVAFLMRSEGLSFSEVLRRFDGLANESSVSGQSDNDEPCHGVNDQPPNEDWQIAALTAVGTAARYLHDGEHYDARMAWHYLRRQRGLSPDTIRASTIGYNPGWEQIEGAGWLAPGIIIPAMVDGDLWYVQVRTTKAARQAAKQEGRPLGKYHALGGSKLKALFNADALLGADIAVVTEGEFDALLLNQFLPSGVTAVTMGSAGALPVPVFLRYFAGLQRVLIVMDSDAAGAKGLSRWKDLLSWAEQAPLLPGGQKDVTDYWRSGGNLAAWLAPAISQQPSLEEMRREMSYA